MLFTFLFGFLELYSELQYYIHIAFEREVFHFTTLSILKLYSR